MIVTKDDLIRRKTDFNIERFIKGRISVEIYFKYFYVELIRNELNWDNVKLPFVKRIFN